MILCGRGESDIRDVKGFRSLEGGPSWARVVSILLLLNQSSTLQSPSAISANPSPETPRVAGMPHLDIQGATVKLGLRLLRLKDDCRAQTERGTDLEGQEYLVTWS
jgi:hypothetical protein